MIFSAFEISSHVHALQSVRVFAATIAIHSSKAASRSRKQRGVVPLLSQSLVQMIQEFACRVQVLGDDDDDTTLRSVCGPASHQIKH